MTGANDGVLCRVAVLEQQIIEQKEATNKQIENAFQTAEKAAAKADLAAEKTYLEAQINALRGIFDMQLSASDKAVLKAEAATERRFESVNEFRAALADQQRVAIPRSEFDVQIRALSDRLALNSTRIENLALQQTSIAASAQGKQMGFGVVGSVIMGVIAAVSAAAAVVSFIGHMPMGH